MTFKEYVEIHPIDINISELTITNENLKDIYGIEKYKKIKFLSLYDNDITDISPLKDLIYLQDLYLFGNSIEDISCLKNLNLKVFRCDNNKLTNIDVILNMDNLNNICIARNNLIDKLENYNTDIRWLRLDKIDELRKLLLIEKRKRIINSL